MNDLVLGLWSSLSPGWGYEPFGDMAQWQRVCFACRRFWVQSPVSPMAIFEWSRVRLTLGANEALIAQWQSVRLQTVVLHESVWHLFSIFHISMPGRTLHLNYDATVYQVTIKHHTALLEVLPPISCLQILYYFVDVEWYGTRYC